MHYKLGWIIIARQGQKVNDGALLTNSVMEVLNEATKKEKERK